MLTLHLFIFINIYFTSVSTSEATEYKTELVQVLFRHGDRTPIEAETYPIDSYDPSIYEPFGYGQLTNVGKRREYEIGLKLRTLYGNFLGDTYKPAYVYAYSTDSDRTKMSLQLVLASLYPPSLQLTWHKGINWIPIPTDSNPTALDFLLQNLLCPQYHLLIKQAIQSPKIQQEIVKFKDTIEFVANKTGLPNNEITPYLVHSVIQSHISMGLPYPNWCTKKILRDLKQMAATFFEVLSFTNDMKTLTSGPTIQTFVNNINNQERSEDKRKIYLYSAHDINVSFFLRAHNLTTPAVPAYGSAVIFEKLRGNDGQIYVRILIWTGADKRLIRAKLNTCEEICPWSQYLKIIEPLISEDKTAECLPADTIKKLLNVAIKQFLFNLLKNSRIK